MDKMISVKNISQLQEAILYVRSLKKGYITNFFLDLKKHSLWIEKGVLELSQIGETLFIFKKNDDFYNLFFCSTTLESLSDSLERMQYYNFSIDIVGDQCSIDCLKVPFLEKGFSTYKSLVRMSRGTIAQEQQADRRNNIVCATKEDAKVVLSLLYDHFDKRAEQIPFLEEIENWAEQNTLLLSKKDNKIVGFVAYEMMGVTQYLRYWFVDPECRGDKIGSSLLREFFCKGNQSKRQLFWVLKDNMNAIVRYQHYGFSFEKLFDDVLVYDL